MQPFTDSLEGYLDSPTITLTASHLIEYGYVSIIDIIFKDGKPLNAVPGGSAFNAIISLGRCGVNSTFISEAGNDRIGDCVINFLNSTESIDNQANL